MYQNKTDEIFYLFYNIDLYQIENRKKKRIAKKQ